MCLPKVSLSPAALPLLRQEMPVHGSGSANFLSIMVGGYAVPVKRRPALHSAQYVAVDNRLLQLRVWSLPHQIVGWLEQL